MPHMTVVRNEAYQASGFNVRERHNERKNENYFNGDIDKKRAELNIHFKQNFNADGKVETYEETFNRLLAEKKIVKHGLRADAKVFCEMIFDVNTTFFDENGGYEYAKKFFEEAYRMAVKEAGSEDYILSAVMHADERNKALSEQLGRDVYHYHLHVVYVPVVEKKLYFNKNNKNPELAGKLKSVIPQISQSNKWPLRVPAERNGKTIMLNSYSLLQDRYFEHMKSAGFDGFERGQRGSTAEHLDVLDFKIKQDTARAEALNEIIENKETAAVKLDKKVEHKEKQIKYLDKKLELRERAQSDMAILDNFGNNKTILGQIIVSPNEATDIKKLVQEAVASRGEISELRFKLNRANHEIDTAIKERDTWKSKYQALYEKVKMFLSALKHAPKRVMGFLSDIMRQPPEKVESEVIRNKKQKSKQQEVSM